MNDLDPGGLSRDLSHCRLPSRRFATEQVSFDDQIGHLTVVSDKILNMPSPVGAELTVRLTLPFEMKDGKITREIAHEMWREEGAANAVDITSPGAQEIVFAHA